MNQEGFTMSQSICSVPKCERPVAVKERGWCMPCYKRWWRLPEPRPQVPPELPRKRPPRFCDRCNDPIGYSGKSGLCHPCWLRRDNVRVEEVVRYGITFRRYPDATARTHQDYFKPGGYDVERGIEALHREIYKREVGPIPKGWDVHHKDHDTSNNSLSNLECLPKYRHLSHHGKQPRTEAQRKHWKKVQEAAKAWHGSPEGREWHRKHAIEIAAKRKRAA